MGMLRYLLAISVVLGHAGPVFGFFMVDGGTAVQVFFMISGFYMGLILNEKYNWAGAYPIFISNRLYRIFPLFLAALAVSVLLELAVYVGRSEPLNTISNFGNTVFNITTAPYLGDGHWSNVAAMVFTNVAVVFRSLLYFVRPDPLDGGWHLITDGRFLLGLGETQFVPQAWSLDMELIFYGIAPLIARLRLRRLVMLLAASIVFRLVFQQQIALRYPAMLSPALYFFFPAQLMFFMAGLVSYRLMARFRDRVNLGAAPLISAGLVLFILAFDVIPIDSGIKTKLLYLAVFIGLPFAFAAHAGHATDQWIGELSFPIYVLHVVVLTAATALGTPGEWMGTLCVAGTTAAAVAANRLVSEPIEAFRRRRLEAARRRIRP